MGLIDYDFQSLKIPQKTNIMICVRAALIDHIVRDFLRKNPDSVVLHLGCELDSRYLRIDNPEVNWYDLDFPDVIALKRQFFPETERYHLTASSVTDLAWLDRVLPGKKHYLVVGEGLFMYRKEADAKYSVL